MATWLPVFLLIALAAVEAYDHPWNGGKQPSCDLPRTEDLCGPSAGEYWPDLFIYQQHRRGCEKRKVCPGLLSFAFRNPGECQRAHKHCSKWASCVKKLELEEEERG
uniref:Hypothetical secreted protein n=1 Tax=Ornithodoros coriaceus TaxID=92741 RepID=B2D269_ORNCO|nr:hypothetical secreted protein precursor [Ornithodoros coriaceus]